MLTNKDIIEGLEAVGYTVKDISDWTKIVIDNIEKMKNNEDIGEGYDKILNQFFRLNMEEVDIDNFKDEDYRNTHLIMTPNGFKKVTSFEDKGKQHSFKISFGGFDVIAVDKHEFKTSEDKWITIDKVKVGDKLKVFDSESEVISIEDNNDIECCAITIEDGEYYLDGLISR